MGSKAIKQGDKIEPAPSGTHAHFVLVPPSVTTKTPAYQVTWTITDNVSQDVFIHSKGAAVAGSGGAIKHQPVPSNGTFMNPKLMRACEATITRGSSTVLINGKPAARVEQTPCCRTDNEPNSESSGQVVPAGECRVYIG